MSRNIIVKNTIIQSLKLVANIFIGLYSTRLTIQFLGVTNFGAFSLLGGVVSMLAMLKSTLTNTSLRYFAFTSGYESQNEKNEYFNTAIFLHILVAIATLILVTLLGYVCFEYKFIKIPPEIFGEAFWSYQLLSLLTFVSILNAPVDALLVAKENFSAIAIADLSLSIGKVIGIILLTFLTLDGYKIVYYTSLIFCLETIARFVKYVYISKRYSEYKIRLFRDTKKSCLKDMLSFSLWNLVGTVTVILRRQANALILNNFVGVVANAANSLSRTVQNYINNFSLNITKAITPQMMKNAGLGNRNETIKLTNISAKYSSLIFLLLFIPLFLELEYILTIWIGEIPEFTIVFTRLSLIYCLIERLSSSVNTALLAVGEIKELQILELVVVVFFTLITIVAYNVVNIPELIFYNAIVISIVNIFVRMYLGNRFLKLSPVLYFKLSIRPLIVPALLALVMSVFVKYNFNASFFRLALNGLLTSIVFLLTTLIFALSKEEKEIVIDKLRKLW